MPASAVAAIATSPPLRKPRPTDVPPAGFASGARFVAADFNDAAGLGGAGLRAGAARGFDAVGFAGEVLAVVDFAVAALVGALRVAAVLRGAAGLRVADGLRVEPAPRRAGVLGGGGVALLGGGGGGGGGAGGVVSSVISAP